MVPDSVQSSLVRNGRGLLRVSVEVVLYAEWELGPNLFHFGVRSRVRLGRCG